MHVSADWGTPSSRNPSGLIEVRVIVIEDAFVRDRRWKPPALPKNRMAEQHQRTAHKSATMPIMNHTIDAAAFEIECFPTEETTRCMVRLFDLSDWGAVEIPVIIVRGCAPGPLFLAVAGVHGNEYEGMEAIRQVVSELDPLVMHGTFMAILTANPFAYASRTRETSASIDGLNLARVFPGDPEGEPTKRLAAALLELIERLIGPDDLLLDLHSGTAETAFATMAGYRATSGPGRARSEEAARHMGLPLLWEIPDVSGPLNAETARRGIPTVGSETTGRAGCRPEDVASYQQSLRNMLAWLGICPDWPKPIRDNRKALTTIDLLSPATGFLRVEFALLAEVAQGSRLGMIVDPFGDSIAEVRSPVNGMVWAARETPHVDEGDLIFTLAESSRD